MNDTLNMQQLLSLSDIPGMDESDEQVVVHQPLVLIDVASNPKDRTNDLDTDYEVVRKNLHYQQQMLLDMAKACLENAKNSESPRHVEVFATLMGQFTTSNKELLKIHKDMRDITEEKTPSGAGEGGMNIQSANVYMMSPSEMMDAEGDAFEAKEKVRLNSIEG